MEYLNLSVSALGAADFRRASLAERGTWLTLLAYCVQQENGGVIAGFGDWEDPAWDCQQVLGLPLNAINLPKPKLWHLDNGALVVHGYSLEAQKKVAGNKARAGFLNAIRWAKTELCALDSAPDSEAKRARIAELSATISESKSGLESAWASGADSEKKRKGKKGKERESIGAGAPVLPLESLQRMLQVNWLKGRKEGTAWSKKEVASFKAATLDRLGPEVWAVQITPLAAYYGASLPRLRQYWGKPIDGTDDFRRRDLLTLLNNWAGEVDRANEFVAWQEKFEQLRDAGRLGEAQS